MGDLVYISIIGFAVCQNIQLFLIVSVFDAEHKSLRTQLREIVFRPHYANLSIVVLQIFNLIKQKLHRRKPLRGFALRTNWEVFGKSMFSKAIFRKKKKP